MINRQALVRDTMTLLPVFVYETSSLLTALDKMRNFEIESIPIIKEDFSVVGTITKSNAIKFLSLNISKNKKIKDILNKYVHPIVLYPRMTVNDAYSTMKYFNVKGLPVVDLPWEKKLVGYLWLKDIMPFIELKVSV